MSILLVTQGDLFGYFPQTRRVELHLFGYARNTIDSFLRSTYTTGTGLRFETSSDLYHWHPPYLTRDARRVAYFYRSCRHHRESSGIGADWQTERPHSQFDNSTHT